MLNALFIAYLVWGKNCDYVYYYVLIYDFLNY